MLSDPKLFNYFIICVYLINSARWAIAMSWADVAYWICAAGITATVTWGYAR